MDGLKPWTLQGFGWRFKKFKNLWLLNACLGTRCKPRSQNFWIFFIFFCYFKNRRLVFLDHFDVLMSKMIFKKWKNIILIYFGTKSTLKSYRNRTPKRVIKSLSRSMWTKKKKQQLSNSLFYYVFKSSIWLFSLNSDTSIQSK